MSRDAIRARIAAVIQDRGDTWSLKIVYLNELGVLKLRYISPTSWIDRERTAFNAVCLTDMGQRKMFVSRVKFAERVRSHEMQAGMPQAIWDGERWVVQERSDNESACADGPPPKTVM